MIFDDRVESEMATLLVPLRIRRCVAADLRALEWHGMYTAHREIIEAAFEAQQRGDNAMLVADVRGRPWGQVWIDLARRREERVGVLWAVRVHPALRGLGIGRRLLRAAERLLLEQDYHAAEIEVARSNAGARRLYERLGYLVIGRYEGSFGYTPPGSRERVEVPRDEWVLRKSLRPQVHPGTQAPDPHRWWRDGR